MHTLINMTSRFQILKKEAKSFPKTPGVYLMKDIKEHVIYVGKASSLSDRISSYFNPSTDLGPRKQPLLEEMYTIDVIECDGEWEALLTEARLIKDLRPKFNVLMVDDKTYPYLVVTIKEDFPRVLISRNPSDNSLKGARVFGPFVSVNELRHSLHILQRIFKYRTCNLDIKEDDPKNKSFRPCLLHSTGQCTAPCNNRISVSEYKKDIDDFTNFLNSKRSAFLKSLEKEMKSLSMQKEYEKASVKRDQIKAIKSLDHRLKDTNYDWRTEVSLLSGDPSKGVISLQKVLNLDKPVRYIEALDIAHLSGTETVGAKVCFIDGRPFKEGYRRYKIKTSKNDDYAAMREIISRRYREAGKGLELFPDVILIDGGKGQLSASKDAFESLGVKPPCLIGLAKKEEKIYFVDDLEPLKLSKNHTGLKLCQSIRDEAHRFARTYHHILRKKKLFNAK